MWGGVKTGDTFDPLLFLFTFLSLGFLVLTSSILDAVGLLFDLQVPAFVSIQNVLFFF